MDDVLAVTFILTSLCVAVLVAIAAACRLLLASGFFNQPVTVQSATAHSESVALTSQAAGHVIKDIDAYRVGDF